MPNSLLRIDVYCISPKNSVVVFFSKRKKNVLQALAAVSLGIHTAPYHPFGMVRTIARLFLT
jgi:hypothetical protein